MSSGWAMRRFWSAAEAEEVAGGYRVTLDGRPVRTPAKAQLLLPTRDYAAAIAEEWQAQGETIDPTSMPMTRSANAAIDKLSVQHAEVADMLADYGDSDLLCYRAESPEELVLRQAETWDPYLDWAASRYDARLEPRTGLMHRPQDPEALERLRSEVHAMDIFGLAAFHDLVSLTGSLVLGLAATDKQDAEAIWSASRLDEDWQAELWGADEEATELAELKRQSFLDAIRAWRLSRLGRA